MARFGKLILLQIGFFLVIAIHSRIAFSYEGHHRHHQTLSLCDVSDESTEECYEKIPDKFPTFLLFKYENREKGEYVTISKDGKMDEESVRAANPHKGSVWKILIHGFLNNATTPFPVNVRDAYVKKSQKTGIMYNLLIVDWGSLACASMPNAQGYLYNYAAKNTAHVGRTLGKLIVFLHTHEYLDLTKDVHLIGHSLGAHVCGQAGRHVFDMTGKTVRRISGLDPAGPSFWAWRYLPDFVIPRRRLQRKDTQFADVYHTSRLFGSSEVMGDVDFWISGGESQPSCVPKVLSIFGIKDFVQVCSHNYATTLYAQSILDSSMKACLCPSHRSYSWGTCKCDDRAIVGEMLDNSTITVGEYYYDPPRDDSILKSMTSWKDFSLLSMIKSLADMICKEK